MANASRSPSGSRAFCQAANGDAISLLNAALESASVGVPVEGGAFGKDATAAASSGSTPGMMRRMGGCPISGLS